MFLGWAIGVASTLFIPCFQGSYSPMAETGVTYETIRVMQLREKNLSSEMIIWEKQKKEGSMETTELSLSTKDRIDWARREESTLWMLCSVI